MEYVKKRCLYNPENNCNFHLYILLASIIKVESRDNALRTYEIKHIWGILMILCVYIRYSFDVWSIILYELMCRY